MWGIKLNFIRNWDRGCYLLVEYLPSGTKRTKSPFLLTFSILETTGGFRFLTFALFVFVYVFPKGSCVCILEHVEASNEHWVCVGCVCVFFFFLMGPQVTHDFGQY